MTGSNALYVYAALAILRANPALEGDIVAGRIPLLQTARGLKAAAKAIAGICEATRDGHRDGLVAVGRTLTDALGTAAMWDEVLVPAL
jgi:hypothetical protein